MSKDRFAGVTDEALELGLEVSQMGGFVRNPDNLDDAWSYLRELERAHLARHGFWIPKHAAEAMRIELERRRLTKLLSAAYPAAESDMDTLKEADDCSSGCKVKRAVEEFVSGLDTDPTTATEPAAAEPTPGGDDWIAWNGPAGRSARPLPDDIRVEVKLRCGEIVVGPTRIFHWTNQGLSGDIVAYRSLGQLPKNQPIANGAEAIADF